MGERTVTVPIDPIDRGIDRLDTNVRNGKIVEGLNVINDDGDLRRRDAFKTIYTAAPHFLPPGLVTVYFSDGDPESETATLRTDRVGNVTSTKRIYIGCEEPFDGADFSQIAYTVVPTGPISFVGYYRGASSWTAMDFLFDTTRGGRDSAGDPTYHHFVPLSKNGRVSWHRGDFTSWTAASGSIGAGGGSLGATNLYWVYLELRTYPANTAIVALPGTSAITAPGIRAFHLSKINGIFPVRTKKKDVLVVCSDREERRGSEKGAMVGLVESPSDPTKQLHLIQDEGSGTHGEITISEWNEVSGTPVPLGSGAPTGSTSTYGTSGVFERQATVDTVAWYPAPLSRESEWRGGLALDISDASDVDDNGAGSDEGAISITQAGVVANQFEHHLLRIIDGTGDGEERMIYKNTASSGSNKVVLSVYDDFSAGAPSDASKVKIFRPHARLELSPSRRDYEVDTNEAHKITTSTRPWAPAIETATDATQLQFDIDREGVQYYVGRNPRWEIPSGISWTATYDNNSNSLYLANDHSQVLRFDGKHLRVLQPETDTNKDWHADRYANFLFLSDTQRTALNKSGITETAFLENSPIIAHILVSFLRRLFAIGTSIGDSTFRFTGENAYHVWPSGFIHTAADEQNRQIQGAASMNNRLVLWSSRSIMEFVFMNTENEFDTRILHTGGGFVSHHGVQVIKSTLIGPNTDGIYGFNGANLQPVLDDWARVIKGGINTQRLNRSSSVHLQQRGWYMIAVASAGSDHNDRIVIWDYVRNRFWLWSAPHGASFLAKDYDENGAERLLVGTNDGHIQTMTGATKDDGKAITSYARTVPLNLFGEKEAAYTGVQSVVQNSASAMELKFFIDKRGLESKEIALSADAGLNQLGNFALGNAATGTIGDTRYKTTNNNLNAKGRDFQVQMGGNSPWRLRRMYITARDIGKR